MHKHQHVLAGVQGPQLPWLDSSQLAQQVGGGCRHGQQVRPGALQHKMKDADDSLVGAGCIGLHRARARARRAEYVRCLLSVCPAK